MPRNPSEYCAPEPLAPLSPACAAPGGDNGNRGAAPQAEETASLAPYPGVAQTDNATAWDLRVTPEPTLWAYSITGEKLKFSKQRSKHFQAFLRPLF